MAVNFAILENEIEWFIWRLIGLDEPIGMIVTTELSFRNLVGLLSSLSKVKISDPVILEKIDKLGGRALDAEGKRNTIMHSLWGMGETPDTVVRIKKTAKRTKGLQHQLETMTVEDLTAIATFIDETASSISDLMHSYYHPNPS